MKKSRLLHSSGFGRKKRTCFMMEFKKLVKHWQKFFEIGGDNVGK